MNILQRRLSPIVMIGAVVVVLIVIVGGVFLVRRLTRESSTSMMAPVMSADELAAMNAMIGPQNGSPSVEVTNQVSVNGEVMVASAYSAGPGFIVIHADDNGSIGESVGQRALDSGWNYNISVPVNTMAATPTFYAMLHADTGEIGVYEFGAVEGADEPVSMDEDIIAPSFAVDIVYATDQFVTDNQVTIASVTMQAEGWLVIHAGDADSYGDVLGVTHVDAGTSTNVVVDLAEEELTAMLWPVLHEDTNAGGEFEFSTVEGADEPVIINEEAAATPIWTVPHIRVSDQVLIHGDGIPTEDAAPALVVASVLSDGPGFLAVHGETDDTYGEVIGYTAVPAGLSTNISIAVDADKLSRRVWPILYEDTSIEGEFAFGTVEDADEPVIINPPITVVPSLRFQDQRLDHNRVYLSRVVMDAPGWLAIHGSDNGNVGPVIAVYPLLAGSNVGIFVTVDPARTGDLVFPMLHYDTDQMGIFENSSLRNPDAPVFVRGEIMYGRINLMGE